MRIDIAYILLDELEKTIPRIVSNMQSNNQVVTGRTAASLRAEVNDTTGILWGAEHISTLETGISPFQSRMSPFKTTYYNLRQWYIDRGIAMSDVKTDRRIFRATVNQREIGSVLFRKQQGKPTGLVYGKEVNPLVNNIKNRISDIIINTKILE